MNPGYYSHFFFKKKHQRKTRRLKRNQYAHFFHSPHPRTDGEKRIYRRLQWIYAELFSARRTMNKFSIVLFFYYQFVCVQSKSTVYFGSSASAYIFFFRPSIFACSPIFWFDTLSCVQQARGSLLPPSCRMIIIMYLEWGNLFKNIQRLRTKTL